MTTADKATKLRQFTSTGLKYQDGRLWVLDQQLIPWQEKWIECLNPTHMGEIIYKLKVRGAPLIGVAAAYALASYAENNPSFDGDDIMAQATKLRSARPTAVNLAVAVDRMMESFQQSGFDSISMIQCAWQIFAEDVALCEGMAKHGGTLISDGDSILTHCNSGGLATAGLGTALGVLINSHQEGKKIHVYVDETRPLLQGGRLTTWELNKHQIPHTLICDNMAASLMASGKIDKVMVGADRIAANGDFANKIGTYSVAVNAHYHKVPFYVAAPCTTVDIDCPDGANIPVEQRDACEVKGVTTIDGNVSWSPKESDTYNPAFDVTPAKLVTGWILESGIFDYKDVTEGILTHLPVKQS
jgi:methylthioribose-1-phosphate isomerase